MITTLTLSPCIDKTVTLPRFERDKVNRAASVQLDPGGKGVNVSLALAKMGLPGRAILLGYEGCGRISSALREAGVEAVEIACEGTLRTNLKIFELETGETLELNEQNPTVGEKTLAQVVDACRMATQDSELLVLSGSLPQGVPTDIYRQIAEAVREENPSVKILLDSAGKPLLEGLRGSPDIIKPNIEELELSFGVKLGGIDEISSLCKRILTEYSVGAALVSMGAEGALLVGKCYALRGKAVRVAVRSAQGAGDAMVAGACSAIVKGEESEILRYGLACAAAAVETVGTGFGSAERVAELLEAAKVEVMFGA